MSRRNKQEVATWDAELAKQAEIAAGLEASSGGGQFFSTRGGILSWQDAPLPGNEMVVVILDSIFENVYYQERFNAEVQTPPTCFAFAREEGDLAPHVIVSDMGQHQSDTCQNCEHNEWGSADTGKGKACRNTRRLAMVPAGQITRSGDIELFEDPDHFASTTVGFMKLPVTSVKGYANFVRQVAGALKRPPFGIVTRVSVVPDAKTQFKVLFEPVEKLADELMPTIMERREEVMATIDFPYSLEVDDEPAPKQRAHKREARAPRRQRRKY